MRLRTVLTLFVAQLNHFTGVVVEAGEPVTAFELPCAVALFTCQLMCYQGRSWKTHSARVLSGAGHAVLFVELKIRHWTVRDWWLSPWSSTGGCTVALSVITVASSIVVTTLWRGRVSSWWAWRSWWAWWTVVDLWRTWWAGSTWRA